MTASERSNETATRVDPATDGSDGLGAEVKVPRGSWRDRVRSKPGLREAYRIGVFLLGLLCIAIGVGLAALPGPLTIPPVLLGLWIWSTEFRFAERFFDSFREKGHEAWAHAKAHPASSAVITVGGLAATAAVIWAASRFELVDKGRAALGL